MGFQFQPAAANQKQSVEPVSKTGGKNLWVFCEGRKVACWACKERGQRVSAGGQRGDESGPHPGHGDWEGEGRDWTRQEEYPVHAGGRDRVYSIDQFFTGESCFKWQTFMSIPPSLGEGGQCGMA